MIIPLAQYRAARRNVRAPDPRDELAAARELRRRRAEAEYGVRVQADGTEAPLDGGMK